jgi:uncharacterized protein (TIGR02145 family)
MINSDNIFKIFLLWQLCALSILVIGCEKGPIPTISTREISNISETSATCGGYGILAEGNSIVAKGVCWNTLEGPTVENNKTNDGDGIGSFLSNITGLLPNTTYYLRAYAINDAGTGYGEQVVLKTYSGKVADVDGNVYYTVTINDRIWMAENLKTTKYADGSPVALLESQSSWYASTDTAMAYCWYNSDINNESIYGALYNWRGALKGNPGRITDPRDRQGACPNGWHVPDITEWTEMIDFLGGDSIAGGKLKESGTKHWRNINVGAINESGFTGLPGGYRSHYGIFESFGYSGYWWSSTEDPNASGMVYVRGLWGSVKHSNFNISSKRDAMSIRCIKNR